MTTEETFLEATKRTASMLRHGPLERVRRRRAARRRAGAGGEGSLTPTPVAESRPPKQRKLSEDRLGSAAWYATMMEHEVASCGRTVLDSIPRPEVPASVLATIQEGEAIAARRRATPEPERREPSLDAVRARMAARLLGEDVGTEPSADGGMIPPTVVASRPTLGEGWSATTGGYVHGTHGRISLDASGGWRHHSPDGSGRIVKSGTSTQSLQEYTRTLKDPTDGMGDSPAASEALSVVRGKLFGPALKAGLHARLVESLGLRTERREGETDGASDLHSRLARAVRR